MAQGRQAKILAPAQENRVLKHLATGRYPERDRALFLLSIKAGLRAKEVAGLTWSMITDPDGNVSSTIELEDRASKGRGGRTIPLNADLREALAILKASRGDKARPDWPVIFSERGRGMSAASVVNGALVAP